MKSAQAKDMYDAFFKKLGEAYDPAKTKGKWSYGILDLGLVLYGSHYLFTSHTWAPRYPLDGIFGAMMLVDTANDGKLAILCLDYTV